MLKNASELTLVPKNINFPKNCELSAKFRGVQSKPGWRYIRRSDRRRSESASKRALMDWGRNFYWRNEPYERRFRDWSTSLRSPSKTTRQFNWSTGCTSVSKSRKPRGNDSDTSQETNEGGYCWGFETEIHGLRRFGNRYATGRSRLRSNKPEEEIFIWSCLGCWLRSWCLTSRIVVAERREIK